MKNVIKWFSISKLFERPASTVFICYVVKRVFFTILLVALIRENISIGNLYFFPIDLHQIFKEFFWV